MKNIFTVITNNEIADKVYEMTLMGNTDAIKHAGQFVNIKIDGLFLRRPISVCSLNGSALTIIYKVVGRGTEIMSGLKVGATLDLLVGLGNGFDETKSGDKPLLIGGGVGVPPMFELAKRLIARGVLPTVILGFNTEKDVFYVDMFRALLRCPTILTTVDGSVGVKGFVTDAIKAVDGYTYVYTCGPEPMLKAVYDKIETSGEFSFEERMGCGFGACMGCSCKTKYGNKRICKDGPVLVKEEIIW